MACNRKMIMREAKDTPAQNTVHYVNEYTLKSKFFNLEKIMCFAGTPVMVLLLAIEPKRKRKHTDPCKYRKNEKIESNCIRDPEHFAHIYIFSENKTASIRHYIIAFVEGKKFKERDDIDKFINILKNTVCWLKIENKNPYFNIFFFGDHGNQTASDLTMGDIRNIITLELKKYLYYQRKDAFCRLEDAMKDATTFVISSEEYNVNPFKFRVG